MGFLTLTFMANVNGNCDLWKVIFPALSLNFYFSFSMGTAISCSSLCTFNKHFLSCPNLSPILGSINTNQTNKNNQKHTKHTKTHKNNQKPPKKTNNPQKSPITQKNTPKKK